MPCNVSATVTASEAPSMGAREGPGCRATVGPTDIALTLPQQQLSSSRSSPGSLVLTLHDSLPRLQTKLYRHVRQKVHEGRVRTSCVSLAAMHSTRCDSTGLCQCSSDSRSVPESCVLPVSLMMRLQSRHPAAVNGSLQGRSMTCDLCSWRAQRPQQQSLAGQQARCPRLPHQAKRTEPAHGIRPLAARRQLH